MLSSAIQWVNFRQSISRTWDAPASSVASSFASKSDVQRQPPRCRESPLNRPRCPDSPSAVSQLLPGLTSFHRLTGQLPSLETGLSPRGKLFVQRKDKACRSTPPPASIRAAVPSAAGISVTRSEQCNDEHVLRRIRRAPIRTWPSRGPRALVRGLFANKKIHSGKQVYFQVAAARV